MRPLSTAFDSEEKKPDPSASGGGSLVERAEMRPSGFETPMLRSRHLNATGWAMGRPFDVPEPVELDEQEGKSFSSLVALMQRLLAPDGCPWDREQTFETLRKYVLEEACEVIDAIDSGDRQHLCEELGDLALQVTFLSELARAERAFGPDDVVRGVVDKLVRRHPHVFEEENSLSPEEVERNWSRIKAEEKKRRPLLDDIPRSLPALVGARRISERVASVGFDWEDGRGSRAKVDEELAELDEAVRSSDKHAMEHELGDVMLAIVNYARHLGIEPEVALRKTTERFRDRFSYVEAEVQKAHGDWPRQDGKPTTGIPLAELDGFWREAKKRK